ncbi:ccr4 associated factor [Xylographa carneopallida]|nr:ccr4 associated factor [Xylographa carneopallida]
MKYSLNQYTTLYARHRVCRRLSGVSPPVAYVRRRFSSEPVHDLPSAIPLAGHAHLTNRALISLTGRDASRFLQGLTTANIPPASVAAPGVTASKPGAVYSAFLNAQGRLLHDVFIYPITNITQPGFSSFRSDGDESFLIEVDAIEQDRLFRWLKRYKLRSKISLRAVNPEECGVWSFWDYPESLPIDKKTDYPDNSSSYPGEAAVFLDLRAPGLGCRFLLPQRLNSPSDTSGIPTSTALGLSNHSAHSTLTQYTLRRYLYGIPEGQSELPRENALLQESCIDHMGGVDFRKGCYVGQELVIRTQHTGVVRKRILPVLLYDNISLTDRTSDKGSGSKEATPVLEYNGDEAQRMQQQITGTLAGADIVKVDGKGRRIAKWMGGVGNLGLALWRLENMEGEFAIKGEASDSGYIPGALASKVKVKPFVPKWWNERKRSTSSV